MANDIYRGPGLGRFLLLIVLVLILAVAGVWFYNKSHSVTVGDRVGKVIDELPVGASKAADELKDSPALAKAGDAIKESGHAASSALSKTGAATERVVTDAKEDVKAAADKQKENNADKK
ncbi:hypothetical protein [Asticcacaulis sp. 201]|uniref:hypothetical protein n=1 Tax=Asticcacaulis sp. 201 TaxID=3028787 RepID=UPI00291618B2|nr:hypothetical protein [Asticcacaulis sp. 201]MDV6332242.1 hypothetical protein [Asticcacaulis sp. 201]